MTTPLLDMQPKRCEEHCDAFGCLFANVLDSFGDAFIEVKGEWDNPHKNEILSTFTFIQ